VIRRNLITKPLAWMSQAWTVKNLIELKNAMNVLVEGNTIENNWAAGQQGYGIVLTPRNQDGTAPWSTVRNITIQNNVIRHVAAVFNVLGYDNIAPSQQTLAIVVRNNLVYDVSTKYGTAGNPANGWFAVIGAGPRDITIDHNTVDNDGGSIIQFYAGAAPDTRIYGFVLTNNLMRRNKYGVIGSNSAEGTATLSAYTPGAIVLRNTFAGAAVRSYPVGNDFPTLAQWLADFTSVSAVNYQLVPTSLSRNAGSDRKDIGVDFAELNPASNGASRSVVTGRPVAADFDGDAMSDVAVFEPSTGEWHTAQSGSGIATVRRWGGNGDVPVARDYDGDGKVDIAVFRPSNGTWHIIKSTTGLGVSYTFGGRGDIPVPGDYNGDGTTDIAVFRPSSGTWYLGTGGAFAFGGSGDIPVPGDYNGDGRTDIAVFRPSNGTWYIGTGEAYAFGGGGDIPVPGDYNGDGKTDSAVFRPSTGQWFIGTGATFTWGGSGDIPVPGDYDGDGRTDVAVFRPSTSIWYIIKSSTSASITYTWGGWGDVPTEQRPQ
jgi:hypothetical protein